MLPQPDPIGLVWSGELATIPLGRPFRDEFLSVAKGEGALPAIGLMSDESRLGP
jgi:hypothetical protein